MILEIALGIFLAAVLISIVGALCALAIVAITYFIERKTLKDLRTPKKR